MTKMTKPYFFTISSFNYLSQAAALKQSLSITHSDVEFVVFLCDEITGKIPNHLKNTDIIPMSQISLPNYEEMCTKYNILELNTAVKPFCMLYLADHLGADFCFYLDPDLVVVDRMSECFELIESGAAIILTPHTVEPIEDALRPNDFDIARAGIYNLGFCGVSSGAEGRRFVAWWARKLLHDCRIDLEHGIFVDQKWCDAVPAMFENVRILRHEGYNVGYWNLMHRPLWTREDGTLMAGRDEARVLHFSGIDMLDSNNVSKHQSRLFMSNLNETTRDAFARYRFNMIDSNYFSLIKTKPSLPGYRVFENDNLSAFYARQLDDGLKAAGVKARLPSRNDFVTFDLTIDRPAPEPRFPDFFMALRRMRPDVEAHFPNIHSPAGARNFLGWCQRELAVEMPLGKEAPLQLVQTMSALDMALSTLEGTPSASRDVPEKYLKAFATIESAPFETVLNGILCLMGDFAAGANLSLHGDLPASLVLIRQSRADLSDSFDLNTKEGRHGLVRWAVENLETEYGTSKTIAGLVSHLEDSSWRRSPKSSVESSSQVGSDRAMSAHAWSEAIDFARKDASDYRLFSDRSDSGPLPKSVGAQFVALEPLSDKVSLIGYPRAEMGMGEHVRNTAGALRNASVPFDILDFNIDLQCGLGNTEFLADVRVQPTGRINIFHINADQTIVADRILGPALFKGRYNIGYWAWELEKFPREWQAAIDLVDEIWAPSRFIQKSIQQVTGSR